MEPKAGQRPVDTYYEDYNAVYKRMALGPVAYISVILIMFGLMGVAWAMPFPVIAFLGKYKGYINWASFLIAVAIYYYLRLSPMVSYLLLLVLFTFSYLIIELEQWQKAGGAPLLAVSAVLLMVGLLGQLLVLNQAKASPIRKLMLSSPAWAAVSLLKKVKIKY